MTLGLCERYREKPKDEEAAFRRALDIEPSRPDASLQLAWRLEVSGRVSEAGDVLRAVAEDRREVGHWMALGRLAAAKGEDGVAREHWTRAVILLPNEPSVYQGIWNSTALKKRFLEFADSMRTVIASHPKAWLPYYYLGFAHRYAKRPREAIAAFEKTLELNPKEVRARFLIGEVLREDLGDQNASIEVYLAVLEADPENASARRTLTSLGLTCAGEKDLRRAERIFRALAKAEFGEWSHTANLALIRKELGDPEGALALYADAEKEFPFEPQIPNDRGLMLMGLGRDEEALAAFRAALERDDEFLDALENLGAYTRLKGDLDASLSYFRRAYERVRREDGDPSKFRAYMDTVAREREERRR